MAILESVEVKQNYTVKTQEFGSLHEYEKYINETPLNEVFRWASHKSVEGTESFTKTKSYPEAIDLFHNGWDDMAKKLEQKLKIAEAKVQSKMVKRTQFDVVGFQASVPRYLQGIPTNMVNQKQVPQKQKIVTLNKDISYAWYVTTEEIIESSVKALQIVKRIEEQGIRVNLNLIMGTEVNGERIISKIRLKSANERINISKLAFPLVHPSMLRRLQFRYIETTPHVTKTGFTNGYGSPTKEENLKYDGEILIPKLVDSIEEMVEKVCKKQ